MFAPGSNGAYSFNIDSFIFTLWRFRGSDLFFSLLLLGCSIPFRVVFFNPATEKRIG